MATPSDNPFDTPLQSELGEHQAAQTQTVAASQNSNPFDEPLLSEKAENNRPATGQITNDVGNTVIVPKDGESFADTMKRAAIQGKQTTPEQINKEVATMPEKATEVLGAASAPMAATELGELAIKHLAGNVLPGMEAQAAKASIMQAIPTIKQLVGAGFTYEGLKHLFAAVTGPKK